MIAILVASLALQDIYHGEADVTLEWTVVRIPCLIIVAFHALALLALRRTFQEPDGRRAHPTPSGGRLEGQ